VRVLVRHFEPVHPLIAQGSHELSELLLASPLALLQLLPHGVGTGTAIAFRDMTDLTESLRVWWDSTATDVERSRLRVIAEDGDASVDADLVASMVQHGVTLVGSRWEGTNSGYAFHLTPDMYDVVLSDVAPEG
jgi:hypothetical protein